MFTDSVMKNLYLVIVEKLVVSLVRQLKTSYKNYTKSCKIHSLTACAYCSIVHVPQALFAFGFAPCTGCSLSSSLRRCGLFSTKTYTISLKSLLYKAFMSHTSYSQVLNDARNSEKIDLHIEN